jgi:hypothetical protein
MAFPRLVEEVELRARRQFGFIPKPDQDVTADMVDFVWAVYGAGLVDLHLSPGPFALQVSDKPLASPLARWQARRSDVVATLHHRTFKLGNTIHRGLLALCDGSRDRGALHADLVKVFESRALDLIDEEGNPVTDMALVGRAIDEELEDFLKKATQSAVFMA